MAKATTGKSKTKSYALEGAALTALAATAAAAYLFAGKKGAKAKAKISDWAEEAHNDVASEIEKLSKLTKGAYDKTVKEVSAKYKDLHSLNAKDVNGFVKEAKSKWTGVSKEVSKFTANAIKEAKKAAAEAAKAAAAAKKALQTEKKKASTTKKKVVPVAKKGAAKKKTK